MCTDAKCRFIVLSVVYGNQKISKKCFVFLDIGKLDFGGELDLEVNWNLNYKDISTYASFRNTGKPNLF